MLSPAVPPFHAPKVEEKTPHSTKSCHTKTDLQTGEHLKRKKYKDGKEASQALREKEKKIPAIGNKDETTVGRSSADRLSSSEKRIFSLDASLHRPILHGAARIQFQLFSPACTPSWLATAIIHRSVHPSVLKCSQGFLHPSVLKCSQMFFTSICVKMLLEPRGPEKNTLDILNLL